MYIKVTDVVTMWKQIVHITVVLTFHISFILRLTPLFSYLIHKRTGFVQHDCSSRERILKLRQTRNTKIHRLPLGRVVFFHLKIVQHNTYRY